MMNVVFSFALVLLVKATLTQAGVEPESHSSVNNLVFRSKRSTCVDSSPSFCLKWRYNLKWLCGTYRNYCQKTCGVCRVTTVPSAQACRNKHSYCTTYAASGYCKNQRYFNWMKANCAPACGTCPKRPKPCGNLHKSCDYWARTGECKKNPNYMLVYCKKSCRVCGTVMATKKPTPKKTTPTPKKTTPKPMRNCGIPSTKHARIVGGRFASPGAWPWHVAIRSCQNCTTLPFCGGTLINNEWIVTAAHCVQNWLPTELNVILGDTNLRRKDGHEIIVGVKSIFVHNNYAINAAYDNDVALLQLKSPVKFTTHVRPACLADAQPKLPAGTNCTVTGFGRTSENGQKSPRLMQAVVPIKSNVDCKKVFGQLVTSNMFCAGYAQGRIDSCRGDSGGPLVCQGSDGSWRLTGIVSWGKGCARKNQYGVYADVQVLRGWIGTTISKATSTRSG